MLSSTINNKESVYTGAKHGNYSVKVHSEKCSAWYMQYGKYSIRLQMPKQTDLRDDVHPDSHVTARWTVHIVKNDIYFLPCRFTLSSVCICWRRVTWNFFMDNFDLVPLNNLFSILRSFVHVNVLKLLWRKHFLKNNLSPSNCYQFCCWSCGVFTEAANRSVLRNLLKFTGNTCAWQSYFPVNFAKFLTTTFIQNSSGRLLLFLFSLKTKN